MATMPRAEEAVAVRRVRMGRRWIINMVNREGVAAAAREIIRITGMVQGAWVQVLII